MNDVSAVVLSIGEPYTERAIRSVEAQTYPVKETVVVRNVAPFHKALNDGALRVGTEYLIQVDADMILDKDCVNDLMRCMQKDVGLIVGHLRDPLMGRVVGIKIFRTSCLKAHPFKDSISPDTDHIEELLKDGFKTVYALKFSGKDKDIWHTFGEHAPDYSPVYVYAKYLLEGRRYIYRGDIGGFKWHFGELYKSSHKSALLARIAFAHGFFTQIQSDELVPYEDTSELKYVLDVLSNSKARAAVMPLLPLLLSVDPKVAFDRYYRMGITFGKKRAGAAFKDCLDALSCSDDTLALIAQLALCQGLYFTKYENRQAQEFCDTALRMLGGFEKNDIISARINNLKVYFRNGPIKIKP